MRPFVAIDFETANEQRCSACSVGLVKYDEAGQISDRFHSLIRPHPDVDYFSPVNTWVHGLTEDDVADAPQWSEILDEIRAFMRVSDSLCAGVRFTSSPRIGRGTPRLVG